MPLPDELARRFDPLEVLGEGGMGRVLLVRERSSGREVALKLLTQRATPERVKRMRREAELTAQLAHPGIVRVHDAGVAQGMPWVCYERVRGARSLGDAFSLAPLEQRVSWVLEAASALAAAHAAGVIHRDLKPENVLLDADGQVKLVDFGLASAVGLERMTQTGALVGTPTYMAPEQIAGRSSRREPDARTDVWALGVLLFEALTGERPFDAPTLHGLAAAITSGTTPAPSSRAAGVSPGYDAVVARALQVDAERRFPDARSFARALEDAAEGAPAPRSRRGLVGALLGLGLALGAGLLAASQGSDPRPTAQASNASLTLERPPTASLDASVLLEGRVSPPGTPLWVTSEGGRRELPVRPDGTFRTRVPLAPGPNAIEVQAAPPQGAGARQGFTVERLDYPEWFTRLAVAARPTIPLPPGLTPAATEGEYLNAADGSTLIYVPGARQVPFGVDADAFSGDALFHPLSRRAVDVAPFFLGKHEVSWRRFAEFWRREQLQRQPPRPRVETTGSLEEGDMQPLSPPYVAQQGDPAFDVPIDLIRRYCERAGARLPTDYEWELAARGELRRDHPWGDWNPEFANVQGDRDGYLTVAPVDAFPDGASPYGALNMSGNLEEYVLAEDGRDPTELYVRGGSWRHFPVGARTSSRERVGPRPPAVHGQTRGWRICRPAR